MTGVFLNLSKAFYKVWDDCLLHKLRRMGICEKYFGLINSFLSGSFQKFLLNGQNSKWSLIKVGVPQGSILGPFLFLVYINDVPEGLTSNAKFFANDTSIFSVVLGSSSSSLSLKEDLSKISQWTYQWKMLFDPDASKQAQEIISSREKNPFNHSDIYFNNIPLKRENTQKHLGLYLDAKLNFSENINEKIKKAVKGISVIKKVNVTLPRSSLLTICKSFTRPHLDYGDVIYYQPNNNGLSKKIESIQYISALAIIGAIRRTSREKLYEELGFESLKYRRWLRQLCYLHKVLSTKLPTYLYKVIPPILNSHRNPGCYRALYYRTDLYRNSFLLFSINEWNRLDPDIRNLDS